MKNEYIPEPKLADWERIAKEFELRANFLNCLGALDGKHIRIMKPECTWSQFYNYKNFFSIVLLGLVDANYCFIAIDIGSYGRSSDSNIFKRSVFYKKLTSQILHLPKNKPLANYENRSPMPYVFVADEAFAMSTHVMRPFARRNLTLKKTNL